MGHRGMHRRVVIGMMGLALVVVVACSGTSTPTTVAEGQTPATGPNGSTGATGTTTGPGTTTVAASAPNPARASSGCAAAASTAERGEAADVTIDVGGVSRVYREYVPASTVAGTPVPLVLDFHGLTGTRAQEAAVSGWEPLSETEHFVVVTPQGVGAVPSWKATPEDANPDTAFVRAILDKILAEECIDELRVYSNGISNGGLESSILSCRLPDRIAAVGLVSGIVVPDVCRTVTEKPVVIFWGRLDCVLPFYGGTGPCLTGTGTVPTSKSTVPGGVPAVEDAVAAWAGRNGCAAIPDRTTVGDHVEKLTYPRCRNGAAVELYVVSNGGHTWPGSKLAASRDTDPDSPKGITTLEIDATRLMWEFFQRFELAT